MKDDPIFRKWKMSAIFQEIEDDLNFRKWKTTSIFQEMEDDLIFSRYEREPQFLGYGRGHQVFRKWKTS
jgi:hypothetical protein